VALVDFLQPFRDFKQPFISALGSALLEIIFTQANVSSLCRLPSPLLSESGITRSLHNHCSVTTPIPIKSQRFTCWLPLCADVRSNHRGLQRWSSYFRNRPPWTLTVQALAAAITTHVRLVNIWNNDQKASPCFVYRYTKSTPRMHAAGISVHLSCAFLLLHSMQHIRPSFLRQILGKLRREHHVLLQLAAITLCQYVAYTYVYIYACACVRICMRCVCVCVCVFSRACLHVPEGRAIAITSNQESICPPLRHRGVLHQNAPSPYTTAKGNDAGAETANTAYACAR